MTSARRTSLVVLVALLVAAALAYFGNDLRQEAARTSKTPALVPPAWTGARDSPGHAAHVGKGTIACHDCHDESDGGFRFREGACTACHAPEAARTHAGNATTPTACTTCHRFGETPAPACLSCHANAQGGLAAVAVHVTAGSPCTTCHDPHKDRPAAQADCTTCHANVSAVHGAMHVSGEATKQHAATFDASGGALSPPDHWLGAPGSRNARAPHGATGTCTDCHAPHARAEAARSTCKGCHASAPQGAEPSGHAACVTCHTPHDLERSTVKACAGCHADKHAAITPAHAACTTCHAPHATENARSACTSCHDKQVTLGAPKVAAHAACSNCHAPHDAKAAPGAACVTCHATMAVKHAPGRSDKCTDCHAMHPDGHPDARRPGRGGPFAASTAHVAHAENMALAVPCTSCHREHATKGVAMHPPGLACTGCHTPHDFRLSTATGPLCAKCHAGETTIAFASRGHKECVACHADIHKPAREAPCSGCHAAEASTAPAGHRACATCHEPHDGHPKPGATCRSCHAQEAATPHAQVKGGCATCHRPHGPSGPAGPAGAAAPPACTTCHQAAKLPGLHEVIGAAPSAHGQCASCHASHEPARADRATCTTCHAKQKNHQPAATECNGCHIFRAP